MAKKYKIKNTNLYHNGHLEKIGSIVELEDDEAKKLEDVLVEVKEKPVANNNSKTANKNTKTQTPEDNSGEGTKKDETTKTDENGGNA